MIYSTCIKKYHEVVDFFVIKGYIGHMLDKQIKEELVRLLKESQPPSYHAITIPLKEYLELLSIQTREERARDAANKILQKIRTVSKSLGLFLSTVNAKIPLETFFQSFNEAQDDITLYVEDGKVRMTITNEEQQQDRKGEGEHSKEVPSTV
jgi:hypothetical protein